eukprot:1924979-Rhodomonas_salina.1
MDTQTKRNDNDDEKERRKNLEKKATARYPACAVASSKQRNAPSSFQRNPEPSAHYLRLHSCVRARKAAPRTTVGSHARQLSAAPEAALQLSVSQRQKVYAPPT